MPEVVVDEKTYQALQIAARLTNMTPGEVIAGLVAKASAPPPKDSLPDSPEGKVSVYAKYEGHLTKGFYYRSAGRVEITSGPLAGQSFKTPTGAARAVVQHHKPGVSSNRNGWDFWNIDDGSGASLQTIRRD